MHDTLQRMYVRLVTSLNLGLSFVAHILRRSLRNAAGSVVLIAIVFSGDSMDQPLAKRDAARILGPCQKSTIGIGASAAATHAINVPPHRNVRLH